MHRNAVVTMFYFLRRQTHEYQQKNARARGRRADGRGSRGARLREDLAHAGGRLGLSDDAAHRSLRPALGSLPRSSCRSRAGRHRLHARRRHRHRLAVDPRRLRHRLHAHRSCRRGAREEDCRHARRCGARLPRTFPCRMGHGTRRGGGDASVALLRGTSLAASAAGTDVRVLLLDEL